MFALALFAVSDSIWSGVIGSVITAVGALFLAWWNRKKGQYVVVRKVKSTSLVEISKASAARINVTFDEQPVANLSQLELTVTNAGHDVLKEIEVTFDFGPKVTVLDCEIDSKPSVIMRKVSQNRLTFEIPSLNSYPLHREIVTLKFVCDGPTEELEISGRGDGWTVKERDAVTGYKRVMWFVIMQTVILGATVGCLLMVWLLPTPEETGDKGKVFVGLILALVAILVTVVFQGLMIRYQFGRVFAWLLGRKPE